MKHLTSLRVMDLGGNLFQTTLPVWPTLTKLQMIQLDGCSFVGTMHGFLAQTSLLSLDVSSNLLSGPLPGDDVPSGARNLSALRCRSIASAGAAVAGDRNEPPDR